MPIAPVVKTTKLISVHDQEGLLRLEIPSVTPGIYFIPSVNAPDEEFEKCSFSFGGKPPVQYAEKKEIDGHKFVEITVFEGKTPQYGTEFIKGLLDDFGKPMVPPLQRALLTVTPEEIANELERQAVFFDQNIGVRAVDHDPTVEDIVEAERENVKFMQRNVSETSKWSKFGKGQVTDQARSHAWKLHKAGKLNPLPEWATINPDGNSENTVSCPNCKVQVHDEMSRCVTPGCGTILNWALALERGQVLSKDVPRAKRAEAGLEELPPTKSELTAQTKEKVAERFRERDLES